MNSFKEKNSNPSKSRKIANFSTDRDEFTQDHLEFIDKDKKTSKYLQRELTDNTTIYGGGSDLADISINYETKPPKIFNRSKLKDIITSTVNSFEEKSKSIEEDLTSRNMEKTPRES